MKTLHRRLAGLGAALLGPKSYGRRLARKLRADGLFMAPRVATTTPKTSDRDYWDERVAGAREARFALQTFWAARRDSS